MIICICRRISDRSLHQTLAEGARTPGAIFRAHGSPPQCGRCVPFVKSLIEQTLSAAEEGACCLAAAE